MRIAQIAPLAESVPPRLYGGTERVISWLTEELVAAGCNVTLFASGDSVTKARLVPVCPHGMRLGRPRIDPAVAHTLLLEAVACRVADFDIIHCHTDWLHLPLLRRESVPFLTTLHGRLDVPGVPSVLNGFSEAPFISISDSQRSPAPKANWIGTIYHGLPADSLAPRFDRGSYLAFLGRLTADKGPEAAIRIAHAARMPLRIAAKIPRGETRYFKERLEPMIDRGSVELIGEVNEQTKQGFLANAAALLFPINWPEPFGLVMIEAMACGTPVIAFRQGSVPEVVDHGVTGFIVDSDEEAIDAVTRLDQLDRRRVRARFEQRFTSRRMAADYLSHYRRLVGA
jgi:glycosyltransferase involved in cell wall biosynthesis